MMVNNHAFQTMRRQQFRRYFQPSRVLLGIFPAPTESKVNVITLCFSMYCSYRPPMLAVAINDKSATYEHIQTVEEYVLSVPGPTLMDASMYCGLESMREVDKVKDLSLELVDSATVAVPGLLRAIANVELKKSCVLKTGDHLIVVGEVRRFAVNTAINELPLLSIGPYTDGYTLLRKKGIHRLGVVSTHKHGSNSMP
jgi:flavin reductase (DIM6/NTAB) family NADH-FMN oxidoreductase RutF